MPSSAAYSLYPLADIVWVWLLVLTPTLLIYSLKKLFAKRLKSIQFNEVITRTPELAAYMNQGYELLTVILESQGNCFEPVKWGVYNYTENGTLNQQPLFQIDYDTPSRFYQGDNQAFISNYTDNFPLKAELNVSAMSLMVASYTSRVGSVFLDVSMKFYGYSRRGPRFSKKTCAVSSSLLSPKLTYKWLKGQFLKEQDTNTILLFIVSPSIFWRMKVDRLFYVLVHPEMPKQLVASLIHLKITDRDWGWAG
jgi:hypothetical protein